MKVGVYLGRQLLESGGGHIFQREVIHSLIGLEANYNHDFCVFSWYKLPSPELALPPNIQHVSLLRNLKTRLLSKVGEIFWGVSGKVLKKPQGPLGSFRIKMGYERFVLHSILSHGIVVTWSLAPECLTRQIPYITTVWDLEHRKQPYFPEVGAGEEWELREQNYATLLRRASFIITGTKEGKAEIERFYQVAPERIKVLPFPTPHFSTQAAQGDPGQVLIKYKLPKDYLLYPAQFWPHKNHANLLQAVKQLKESYGMVFPLVLVGSDQGNKSYIQDLTMQLGLSNQIYFLGFVPQPDLVCLYRKAFALTFVSFFGPDNLPPLEAFALGCPVIAARVPGAQEQLGEAALLVDPKSPQEIAKAIKWLWEDKGQARRLVELGFQRASKWTGEDYAKGIFSILDEFEAIRCCWGDRYI